MEKSVDESLDWAQERGMAVAFLRPFFFSYYRKLGFSRVADRITAEFPLSRLEFVPLCADSMARVESEAQMHDALAVYSAFSRGRNGLIRRTDGAQYSVGSAEWECSTYLHYDSDGQADGYITLSMQNEVSIDRYRVDRLSVREMAYLSRDALMALLGFLRLYEGRLDTVRLENIAPLPELSWLLEQYTASSFTRLPDCMARLLDPEALLRANAYPFAPGEFTLQVRDDAHLADGVWRVQFEGEAAAIDPLEPDAKWDISIDASALTPLLYGAHTVPLSFVADIRAQKRAEDFLRAFPQRPCGLGDAVP